MTTSIIMVMITTTMATITIMATITTTIIMAITIIIGSRPTMCAVGSRAMPGAKASGRRSSRA